MLFHFRESFRIANSEGRRSLWSYPIEAMQLSCSMAISFEDSGHNFVRI